jgi:hypothetical protein
MFTPLTVLHCKLHPNTEGTPTTSPSKTANTSTSTDTPNAYTSTMPPKPANSRVMGHVRCSVLEKILHSTSTIELHVFAPLEVLLPCV